MQSERSAARLLVPALLVLTLAVPLFARAEQQGGHHSLQKSNSGSAADQRTIPAANSTLDRPARSLRVWLDEEPDVDKSELTLEGPRGELRVEGLHTMGEADLMARVVGPTPDGQYLATWSTVIDGETSSGSWTFHVQRKKPER